MNALRFTLAAAVLGITLAACGNDAPTTPPARAPVQPAPAANDSATVTNTPTEPTTPPPPPDERMPIFGSGA